ncbi:E2 [Camelus dromedarius papillomavirus 1]|uniref:Regulatory protein E2 n=1 Tax=Camelus dromedarius papillomavirus 1 TaxID=996650 RepID=F2YGH2_9PAPI|nr:E2 [Camelus dromedarius papillomavirus 1]ADZ53052.1 E2 [Camelus dromedarius papillomavirus 1]
MVPAAERLLATQEAQMELIEQDSPSLSCHVKYWGLVRAEMALLCAARLKGHKVLGLCPVPPSSVSTAKAKQAILMELELKSLQETQWGRDAWLLTECSYETYSAPPTCTFKKLPRIVEVMFDGNPANRTWHTCWEQIYTRQPDGWVCSKGGADGEGLFVQDSNGGRAYYQYFADDAKRFSATGQWTVIDKDECFVSSTTSTASEFSDSNYRQTETGGSTRGPPAETVCTGDTVDGQAGRTERTSPRLGQTAVSSVSHTYPLESPCVGPIRKRNYRPATHSAPVTFLRCSGPGELLPAVPTLPCPVQKSLARTSEGPETPPSPDSSQASAAGATSEFELFGGQKNACLLISGNANQVKCHRYRLRKYRRKRYEHITTTWWTVSESGSVRLGSATILVTFSTPTQREDFLKAVSLPCGMTVKPISVMCDF